MSELHLVEPDDVLAPLSAVEAERLDKRIRLMAQTTRDNFEEILSRLVDQRVSADLRFGDFRLAVCRV
jgi:hypothetical protein